MCFYLTALCLPFKFPLFLKIFDRSEKRFVSFFSTIQWWAKRHCMCPSRLRLPIFDAQLLARVYYICDENRCATAYAWTVSAFHHKINFNLNTSKSYDNIYAIHNCSFRKQTTSITGTSVTLNNRATIIIPATSLTFYKQMNQNMVRILFPFLFDYGTFNMFEHLCDY